MVTPMKAFRSKCLLALCLLALPTEGQELTPYQERLEKYKKRWEKFIPRYTKLQFAGSMGLISAGLGWDYYRKHWETDVLLGFIPAYADDNAKFTFTAKQNYYPWRIPLGRHFTFEPLACGAYVNILLDREFWGTATRPLSRRLLLVLYTLPFSYLRRRTHHVQAPRRERMA